MASKEKKLIKEEIPEDKVSPYPDLGVGWKVQERWSWNNMRNKLRSHRVYISPSGKKFNTLVSAQEHIALIKELGPGWTVKEKWGRKVYHSPSGQDFPSLKQAKAYVASEKKKKITSGASSSTAAPLAVSSDTKDEEVREGKKKDTTGASSSTLMDIDNTYPTAFGSSSIPVPMDIDSVADGNDSAKSKKDKRKGPYKRKRNDSDNSNCGNASSSSTSGSMDIDRDDEERLRQDNKLRYEEQQRAETGKQANKRRKEENELKRTEDAKKRELKGDRKRKQMEEEEEKRRIEADKEEKAKRDEAITAELATLRAKCEEQERTISKLKDSSSTQSDGGNIAQESTESTGKGDDILVDTFPVALKTSSAGSDDKESNDTLTSASATSQATGGEGNTDRGGNDGDETDKEIASSTTSPAAESTDDNPFEAIRKDLDERDAKATAEAAEDSPKSSDIADMSNPSSVVKNTSDDMSKSSSVVVDSGVLPRTISKVSSEESSSTEERPTSSQLEEMEAKMAAMQAKMDEQEEIISRYESSNEFANQLSTSGKKFDAHLSDKGEGFDAYLSAQGEKLAARLDDNQKDSDGDTVMEVSDGSTPSASSSPPSREETATTDTEVSSGSSLSSPVSASSSCWPCPRCSLENSAANQTCTSCGADQYCQPIAEPSSIPSSLSSLSSASSAGEGQADSVILLGDDLLADIEVDDFRRQVLDHLRCLLENKSVYIQQLGVRQDDNECTVISVLTAIIHAHSADGRVSNEVFRSVITTLGIAVANKVRHLGSQSQFSYLDLESVKQFLQSFLDDVTTLETSETDMFMNSTVRKDFLSQLASDKRVAQGECLKLSVHVPTFANGELEEVDLSLGGTKKPYWFDYDEAMESIRKKKSKLIWLRIEKKVPGAHIVESANRHPDSYHLPFILSGLQLDPGTKATVECKEVGVLALDEDDFKAQVAELKVLPKNKRTIFAVYDGRTKYCCKIKGCKTRGRKDHMCVKHYAKFKKAGRSTTEGDS